MQSGVPSSMESSRAHSSGTSPRPMTRAAAAGKTERMSSVAVKRMLMMSSWSTPFRASSSRRSACTRSYTCSRVSTSTVVAPRKARTAGGTAEIYLAWGGGSGSFLQLAQLGGRERAPVPRRQAAVAHGPDPRAHQPHHGVAHRVAHPPDLPVATLVDHDPEHVRLDEGDACHGGDAVVELYTVAQSPDARARGRTLHLGHILLLHTERRMREAMGEVAVVGHDEQPLGVGIEPSDGEHARRFGYELDHCGSALRIGRGCDHTRRLVQQVVDEPLPDRHGHTVDGDVIPTRIDTPAELGDRAVDRDPPRVDELVTHAPAPEAGACEHLLKPLALDCHSPVTRRSLARPQPL